MANYSALQFCTIDIHLLIATDEAYLPDSSPLFFSSINISDGHQVPLNNFEILENPRKIRREIRIVVF